MCRWCLQLTQVIADVLVQSLGKPEQDRVQVYKRLLMGESDDGVKGGVKRIPWRNETIEVYDGEVEERSVGIQGTHPSSLFSSR